MKRILTLICIVACLVIGPGAAGSCKQAPGARKPSAKVIIPAVNAGVDEFARALPDLGLSPDETRAIGGAVEEVRLSGPLAERAANYDGLSRAERVRLAADVADHLSASASRLSAQNIGVKSEKGRQKLAEYRGHVRLAVIGLRVYAAAVEAGEDPDANPTPQ